MTVHLVITQDVFASWAASIRHRRLSGGGSSLTYTMTFTGKPRWAAPLLEPLARAMFRRETQRRLRVLAAHLAQS